MRCLWILVGALAAAPLAAQDVERKKKPAAKKQQQAAHKKPTPEQIRKFNELAKKQKKKG